MLLYARFSVTTLPILPNSVRQIKYFYAKPKNIPFFFKSCHCEDKLTVYLKERLYFFERIMFCNHFAPLLAARVIVDA